MDPIEQLLVSIIKQAGKITMDFFGNSHVTHTKSDEADVVTNADMASSSLILTAINEHFPDHGVISEEEDDVRADKEYVWIVDPIDGTRNYATHTPLFGISIAVARNSIVEYAAIYLPCTDELFYARKGSGATMNGIPIQCSKKESLQKSYGAGFASWHRERLTILKKFVDAADAYEYWVCGTGSTVVSAVYVAAGKRDWFISSDCNVWDYAAASLILLGSGCRVTNFKGEEWTLQDDEFLAANEALHKQLLKIINSK
ncbi:MAG: inositol monophosphatase [Patescibacteria group bacterium]